MEEIGIYSKLLERITSETELELATTFLDWKEREVYLPAKFQKLMRKEQGAGMEPIFEHNEDSIVTAMDVTVKKKCNKSIIYEEVFSRFFDYLEQIHDFIKMKVINVEDVKSLVYWIKKIDSPEYKDKKLFRRYLEESDYEEVLNLIELFKKEFN